MLKRKQAGRLNDLGITVGFIAVAAIVVYCFYTYQVCGSIGCKMEQVKEVISSKE